MKKLCDKVYLDAEKNCSNVLPPFIMIRIKLSENHNMLGQKYYSDYKRLYLMLKQTGGNYNSNNYSSNKRKVIKIPLQNHPQTPWLDWIEQGIKKYEGRLNRGIFKSLRVNDDVIWYDRRSGKEIRTKIIELKYYPDFVKAYEELGSVLIPIANINNEMVKKLYNNYFLDRDIEMNGVVAIGLEVL